MNATFGFLASPAGRVVRVIAGLALILVGLFVVDGPLSWVLEMIGLIPLLAGLFDFCVFAPLFGLPFVGPQLRQALKK
ncbi:MAG TPA: DUF2892 domain-containing protein [Anaerolineales bacterium]|nr:DUF2892 domain-containing protein [Anaerolineales bacterium]